MTVCIRQGDARKILQEIPSGSVHCVVTSPPYYGLRDYGVAGQLGLEQSLPEYVAEMVAVFREVRRVLRDDGVAWLNLGDAYANDGKWGGETGGKQAYLDDASRKRVGREKRVTGLKSKDLIGIPWRVAFALQYDGWCLRQDNIWAKRNCMPESVQDRTTRAHEYLFMLTKSGDPTFWTHRSLAGIRSKPEPDYRWLDRANDNAETDQEPANWRDEKMADDRKRWRRINLWEANDYFYDATAIEEDGEIAAGTRAAKGSAARADVKQVNGRPPEYYEYTGRRNKRSVWWIATQPFAEAHFAVMPPALVEPCVLAGTSERGCCPLCGAPWVRQVERRVGFASGSGRAGNKPIGKGAGGEQTDSGSYDIRMGPVVDTATIGWLPSCSCPAADPVPCTVLDCFAGAGTAGLVADRLGRDAILIELNPDYCAMAAKRISGDAPLFAEISTGAGRGEATGDP